MGFVRIWEFSAAQQVGGTGLENEEEEWAYTLPTRST
jgi:hypothetical protein